MTTEVAQDEPIPLASVSLEDSLTVVREWLSLSGNTALSATNG